MKRDAEEADARSERREINVRERMGMDEFANEVLKFERWNHADADGFLKMTLPVGTCSM